MSQTQPPEEVLAGKQVDTNAIEIPEAASLKITAKTDESRVRGAAESLRGWARVPGQDPMPLDQALGLVRAKGAILAPDRIPGLDVDEARNSKAMGRSTPATEAVAQAYRKFYGIAVPSSAGTQDFVDTRVKQTKVQPPSEKKVKKVTASKEPEQLKTELPKTVNHPKLYPYLQKIPSRYMWGQNGLYGLEFKSDIDKAIYLSSSNKRDSEGYYSKELSKTKIDFREWLFEVTGLDYNDNNDYDKLTIYRKKILKIINQILNSGLLDDPVIVPPVYDGYFQDIDDDEEEDENEIDKTEDDIEDLDDISDEDISDKKISEDIKEEIVDAVEEDEGDKEDPMAEFDIDSQAIVDGDTDEITDAAKKLLAKKINKPKKESSYTSNKKIFDSMVVNFGRLQSTLDTINNNLEKQNSLIKANIDTQLAIGELVSNQTELLGEKFDAILKEFEKQSDRAKDIADDEKRKAAEDSLEGQRDSAGTRDIDDLTKGGGKSKRGSKIADYYKQKALRRLYRAMPKRLRGGIRKVRKIKQTPSRIASRMTRGITNRMPSSVKRVASGASAIRSASKMTNLPGARTGPLRTLFAGMEYGERKGSGQSELQALGGTGAGLAGGAAGGAGGAKIGAIAGTAIGGAIGFFFAGVGAAPGAAIGLKIGTVAGSLIGGWLGAEKASELADKVTGAHETGTGLTKPGTALLHGTEAVINPNAMSQSSLISDVGGMFIGATTGYLNAVGPMAASISPTIKGISAQMARQYDVPTTLTQTNVGGSLPNLSGELKKVKEKGKQTTGEELSDIEKDLLETQDPESFADKLMKMLDPEGKFQQLLRQLNNPNSMNPDNYAGTGVDGDLKGNIVNPMEGGVMEDYPGAKFGAHRTDKNGRPRKHLGRDVVGPAGMKFVAALPGKVTQIIEVAKLPKGGWSKGVYIKHDNGIETRYLHVNPTVKVGDSVKAGQNLGSITEKDSISTVPHLHFEVLVNGVHRDPEPMIKGSFKLADIGAGKVPGLSIESYSGTPPGVTPAGKPIGVTTNEISKLSDTRDPTKLILGAGHQGPGGKGTASGGVAEHQATAHMLRAIQGLVKQDPDLADKIGFESFTNNNFARDNMAKNTNKGRQFIELHFDQYGGGGRSGVIPSRNARDGVTGNAGTSSFDVALSRYFGNYGANFKKGDLGIPDTGGSILEFGAIDSNKALLKEIKSGIAGPETMKLAQYTHQALREGAKNEGWLSAPTQKPDRFQSMNQAGTSEDKKYLIVNQQAKPQITGQGSQSASSFVSIGDGRWRSENEMSTTIRNLYMQRLGQ